MMVCYSVINIIEVPFRHSQSQILLVDVHNLRRLAIGRVVDLAVVIPIRLGQRYCEFHTIDRVCAARCFCYIATALLHFHRFILVESERHTVTFRQILGLGMGTVHRRIGMVCIYVRNRDAFNIPFPDNQVFRVFAAAGEAEGQGGKHNGRKGFDAFHFVVFNGVDHIMR